MCGFIGFTGKLENKEIILDKMSEAIIHRGPDSFDKYIDDSISIGFRRLSIVDIERGNQPIYNENKNLLLFLNGEIYNFEQLRDDLIEKGHTFYTNSDAEPVLHLFEQYGEKCLDHLRGMFAFVIYDLENKTAFIARDIFGVKPLYYAKINENIVFGSEVKSILLHPSFEKELNLDALEQYLTFQYSVLEETFFKGIFKLLPAHYMIINNNEITITKYWDATFSPTDKSLKETIEQIDAVIQQSIIAHKIGEREIGTFLSSGVDSSYIATCFGGKKAFTVGFDNEGYNEIDYAKILADEVGLEHYSRKISPDEYWETFPNIQYLMDEPLADPAAVALYFVGELASKHVSVVFSGEGADEFFGGYNIYKEVIDLRIVTDMPKFVRKILKKIAQLIPFNFRGKNFLIRAGTPVEERFIGNAKMFSVEEKSKFLKNFKGLSPFEITKPIYDKYKDYDDILKMQMIDIHLWMAGDILLKADKMSMAHSLEVRVPLLDKEVFKVAATIQTDFKVNKQSTKYAFRLAAKTYLPAKVADKKKLGFPVPTRVWLREDKFYNKVLAMFKSENAEKFFVTEQLIKLLDDHKSEKVDNGRKIWTIYTFLVWYNEYFTIR